MCTPIRSFLKEPGLTAWTVNQPFAQHHGPATLCLLTASSPAALLCSCSSNTAVPHCSTSRYIQTLRELRDRYIAGYYVI